MNIKDINWHEIATTKFWFQIDPSKIHPSETAFLYLGAALVIIGIAFLVTSRFVNSFLAKVALRFAKIAIVTGLVEAFWYLLRFENAQVLGSKFVAALILLVGVVTLYGPIRYLITHYKVDMEKAQRQASREKYLTRTK